MAREAMMTAEERGRIRAILEAEGSSADDLQPTGQLRWLDAMDNFEEVHGRLAATSYELAAEVEALTSQLEAGKESLHLLRELLAVIHRDGGHYTEEHGLAKSAADATSIVVGQRRGI